uniref:Uncharacterized protein MANES_13G046400 n=1 Tax=Rhizophora mucronata TaxID=61149 RepID=A0A2P2IVU9_RHIMU
MAATTISFLKPFLSWCFLSPFTPFLFLIFQRFLCSWILMESG